MIDIEQRLSERFHEQVDGIEPHFDIESVIAGTGSVAVISSSARRSNRVVLRAAVAGIADAGIIGLIAVSNRTSPTPTGTAAQPTQPAQTPADDTPTPSIPSGDLNFLVAGATPRHVLGLEGINLFLANPDSNSTCIIIDTGDGYPAGCTENTTIATGEYWQLSHDRPDSPFVLAGVAPDDVTRVVVNGTDALMSNHAWLVVSNVSVDSYTLVHADGTSQTVDLNTSRPPVNTAVPGSTPQSTPSSTPTEAPTPST